MKRISSNILIKLFPLTLGVSLFLASCNNKELSRDKAKALIVQFKKLPMDERKTMPLQSSTDAFFKSPNINAHQFPQKQGLLLQLEQAGLVDYKIHPTYRKVDEVWWIPLGLPGGGMGTSANTESDRTRFRKQGYRQECTISEGYEHIGYVTAEGNKYHPAVVMGGVAFNVATFEFGEISGILEDKQTNKAKVEYTERRVRINPLGKIFGLKEETFSKTVFLTKYDDGWRVDN